MGQLARPVPEQLEEGVRMKQFLGQPGIRPIVRALCLMTLITSLLLAGCGGGGDDGGGGGGAGGGSGGGGSTNPPAPGLALTANAAANGTVNLAWSSTNASSCTASGAWSGSKSPSGSQSVTGVAPGAATFSLECTGAGGTVSRSASVTVAASPPTLALNASSEVVALGSTIALSWTANNVTSCIASGGWVGTKPAAGSENIAAASVGAVEYTLTCAGDGGSVTRSVAVTVNPAAEATLSLIATPASLTVGASFTLEWISSNVTSCTASGVGTGDWSGSKPSSGSAIFTTLSPGTATFTLSCTGPGGSVSQSTTVTITPAPTTEIGLPYILVTVMGFNPYEEVRGFLPAGRNARVFVDVWNEAGTAPVSTATVSINGTSLAYHSGMQAYLADMNVTPGEMITASITVEGTQYEASARQFDTYPTIQTPLDDMTWNSAAANEIRWHGKSSRPGAQLILRMFGPAEQQDWPGPREWVTPNESATSHAVPPEALSAADYLLLVGYADVAVFSGAKSGSAFVLGGFDHRLVSVRSPPALPNVTSLSFKTPPPVAVGVGATKQLSVEATVNCCIPSDWTTEASWSSSDTSVMTVNDTGIVTGVAAGTATVTATYNGVSASMAVRVYTLAPLPAGPPSASTAFQADHTHAGHLTLGVAPELPLTNRWAASFAGRVSYPVVADGRVFVVVDQSNPPNDVLGHSVHALDVHTGATLWTLSQPATLRWAAHTYANGKLFVLTAGGLLRALDATTGEVLWSEQMPGAMGYSAPPVAVNGLVYLSSGQGVMIAVDQADGATLWISSVQNGMDSSPTLGSDGLYASYACSTYRLNPGTGDALWRHRGNCASGGGGMTSILAGSTLLARVFTGSDAVFRAFDVQDGAIVGDFTTPSRPAVAGGTAYFVTSGVLHAVDIATNETLWTYSADPALNTAPLVIDSMVVVGASTGMVYLIDAATGNPLWNGMAEAAVSPTHEGQALIPTGLGAGDGYLLVPGGSTLTGWRMVP
jgi:outer membrane protein assembly factor BamB